MARVLFLLLVIFVSSTEAHRDTTLVFEDGVIKGLPEPFQPATFDDKTLTLTIGESSYELPAVVRSLLFEEIETDPFLREVGQERLVPCRFSFRSSWYHSYLNEGVPEEHQLPPYLSMTISFKRQEACVIMLLFDMTTLRVLRAKMNVKSIGSVPIDLGKVD